MGAMIAVKRVGRGRDSASFGNVHDLLLSFQKMLDRQSLRLQKERIKALNDKGGDTGKQSKKPADVGSKEKGDEKSNDSVPNSDDVETKPSDEEAKPSDETKLCDKDDDPIKGEEDPDNKSENLDNESDKSDEATNPYDESEGFVDEEEEEEENIIPDRETRNRRKPNKESEKENNRPENQAEE